MTKRLLDLARELTDEDWALLEKLNEAGAATAIDLAVRLRMMPEKVSPRLDAFSKQGLVEVRDLGEGHDNKLFLVSDQGRKALRSLNFS